MGKGRRVVEFAGTAPGKQQGRGPRLWAYSYTDLAKLLGTTEQALRSRTSRGSFNPGSLEAVCREWAAARGIVVALALALAAAVAGCGDAEDFPSDGTGGFYAHLGTGGVVAPAGTGGGPGDGVGGSGMGGTVTGAGGRGIGGSGGGLHGTGGVSGTGGMAAQPGTGGSAAVIPECNGTGRPQSTDLCGYAGTTDAKPWVYMFKDGLRCVTCFSAPGVHQVAECLDSIDSPAMLCVDSCSACAY